jgi:tRNA threonylcarbamoyladenosine biosynthesis protein TsaB
MTPAHPLDGVVLAVDASSAQGSAAVVAAGLVTGEATVALRSATEERLLPAIADAMAAAGVRASDLTAIVCGAGPGSFTGLRIAAAAAKGLAMARGLPIFAVPSLALAAAADAGAADGRHVVVLDAMRDERFVQLVTIADGAVASVEAGRASSARGSRPCAGRMRAVRRGSWSSPARPARWTSQRGSPTTGGRRRRR